jgi:DNA-binding transcriptional regulator YdaS (Cro superfamily)
VNEKPVNAAGLATGSEREARVVDPYAGAKPRAWGECLRRGLGTAAAPCPYASCAHSLLAYVVAPGRVDGGVDLLPAGRWLAAGDDAGEAAELPTCALRVAEEGGVTLEYAGGVLGVTRERVRQIEVTALERCETRASPRLRSYLERDPARPAAAGASSVAARAAERPTSLTRPKASELRARGAWAERPDAARTDRAADGAGSEQAPHRRGREAGRALVRRVVAALGTNLAVADALGVDPSNVSHWMTGAYCIPAHRSAQLERMLAERSAGSCAVAPSPDRGPGDLLQGRAAVTVARVVAAEAPPVAVPVLPPAVTAAATGHHAVEEDARAWAMAYLSMRDEATVGEGAGEELDALLEVADKLAAVVLAGEDA